MTRDAETNGMTSISAADTFLARFSELRKSGAGWVARCPAHTDRTPSLHLTPRPGGGWLLYDHGHRCPVDAIPRAVGASWAEILGVSAGPRRRKQPIPRTPVAEARGVVFDEAERSRARAQKWAALYAKADSFRRSSRVIAEMRQAMTVLGAAHPRTWPTLELAARMERQAFQLEAELDAIVAEERPG